MLGNWKVLTLIGKELKLVEETKKYHFTIVEVFYYKRRGSAIADLYNRCKSFTCVDPSIFTQAEVGVLTSSQLSRCVFDWILLESQACMLKFKVKDRSLCLLQVYASNAVSEYQAFEDDVNDALQRVG